MHCKGHQKEKTAPELGNRFAEETARGIAEKGIFAVVPQKKIIIHPKIQSEGSQINFLKTEIKKGGWAATPVGQIVVPPLLLQEIAQREHESTH